MPHTSHARWACLAGLSSVHYRASFARPEPPSKRNHLQEETDMKEAWSTPQVTEQEVGLEVTSYLPAEIETR
jgi:coenzyme PQQ precursor peptide PqqA